jgi:hypothetical protein
LSKMCLLGCGIPTGMLLQFCLNVHHLHINMRCTIARV